jgi:hypothetical protein
MRGMRTFISVNQKVIHIVRRMFAVHWRPKSNPVNKELLWHEATILSLAMANFLHMGPVSLAEAPCFGNPQW